jgi:large subunit ribosomal protein L7/L12
MGIFGSPQEQVDLDDLKARVAKLEAAVEALQARGQLAPQPVGGVATEPDWMVEVRALKAQDKLINAIKVYRERTGVGLAEAKDAVERL